MSDGGYAKRNDISTSDFIWVSKAAVNSVNEFILLLFGLFSHVWAIWIQSRRISQ